jgi:hypothetical protein
MRHSIITTAAIVLLAVSALFAFTSCGPSSTPPPHALPEYLVLRGTASSDFQTILNSKAKEGWKLHSVVADEVLIFVKE